MPSCVQFKTHQSPTFSYKSMQGLFTNDENQNERIDMSDCPRNGQVVTSTLGIEYNVILNGGKSRRRRRASKK